MSNQSIAIIEAAAPVKYGREQVNLIRDTFAKGASDAELALFIQIAERKGLDIFSRQIHLIPRWDKKLNRHVMEPQTGIDGYRLIAERTRKYDGQEGPFWCGKDGEWHDVWLGSSPPLAAKVGVWKIGCARPFWGVALFAEYCQTNAEGRLVGLWAKMPAAQLAKCSESLALRKAFPAELSGIYTREEMAQAEDVAVIDIEPEPPAPPQTTRPALVVAAPLISFVEPEPEDALPEFAPRESEETPEEAEAQHRALEARMKTAWLDGGASESEWSAFFNEKDVPNWTRGQKRTMAEKMEARALAKRGAPVADEIFEGKQPQKHEHAAQRPDGSRKFQTGPNTAEWRAPEDVQQRIENVHGKSTVAALDKLLALVGEWKEKGATLESIHSKIKSVVGEFGDYNALDGAQLAKASHALALWDGLPHEPKKGKRSKK